MKVILPVLILYFTLFHVSKAQNMLGISGSNYAGTNGVIVNPSYAADTRHGFYLNLVSGNVFFTNSYYVWNGPETPYKFFRNGGEFKEDYLLANNLTRPSIINLGIDVRGPSLLLKLSPKSGISINSRIRGSVQGNNISPEVIQLLHKGIDQPDLIDELFSNNTFGINANIVNEIGLTYARSIIEKDNHFLKAGLTVKRLIGSYSAHVLSQEMDFYVRRDEVNDEYFLDINKVDAKYGYSTDEAIEDFEEKLNPFNNKETGSGWGFDFGLSYENRPDVSQYKYTMNGVESLDNRKNKYLYKIGFSLLDIGGVKYNNPRTRSYDVQTTNKIVTEDEVFEAEGDYVELVNNILDVNPSSGNNTLKSSLPSALRLDFDYRLANKIYTNLTIFQNLRGKDAVGMHQNSLVAITPRIETKWFEIAVPLSLMNNYKNFAIGSSVKLGNIFIGSDNLNSIVGIGKAHGADFYLGASIPIFKGKKRDKDKDGVSNGKDNCKDLAGVWNFKGCPDTDGDGIEDKADKCPDVAGLAEFNGCPDTDGDGIPDQEDECAELAGSAAFKGCPDQDGEGIADHLDECPDIAGLTELNGCPDTDADGIIDGKDKCPELAGLPQHDGCPDKDGDNIPDNMDACPELKGDEINKGCPDTDGDGVPDNLDKCPEVHGLKKYDGCLDRDMDGVPDHLDSCPESYGSIENKGCPLVKVEEENELIILNEEETKVVQEAFNNLEFNSGKAVISSNSLENLNSLADLLIGKKEYRLLVSGHTDNVGKKATNLQLSMARANAVKAYLLKAGVAEYQVITEGFGSTRPIASNQTEEGKKQNRRVELKIIK